MCIGCILSPAATSSSSAGTSSSYYYDGLIPGSDPFDADVVLPPPEPRIVGGSIAEPFMAQFFVLSGQDNDTRTTDYLCGAALIHSDMLLTAAHW